MSEISFQHADELAGQSLQLPGLFTKLGLELGTAFYELGRYRDTMEALSRTLDKSSRDDPVRHYALLLIGKSHVALGQGDEARQSFQDLLQSPYVSDEYRKEIETALVFDRAVSFYNAGSYAEAAVLFQDVVRNQEEGDWDQVEYWLGHSLHGKGEYEGARRCYQRMLDAEGATDEQLSDAEEALKSLDLRDDD